MEIRFHKKLYRHGISDRKLASIGRKIARKSPKLHLFLVTLPLEGAGLLEIYWYPELLQTVYQKLEAELVVVGLANNREEAYDLVEEILKDVGWETGRIPMEEFFKECS